MCQEIDRLSSSSSRIAELQGALDAERSRRDELLAAVRDDGCGHSWAAIAAAARLAPSRCHQLATEAAAAAAEAA